MKTQIKVSTAMAKQPTILLKLGQTVTISAGGNYWTRATVDKISEREVNFSAVHVPGIFSFKLKDGIPYIPVTSTLEGFEIIDWKGQRRPQPCN